MSAAGQYSGVGNKKIRWCRVTLKDGTHWNAHAWDGGYNAALVNMFKTEVQGRDRKYLPALRVWLVSCAISKEFGAVLAREAKTHGYTVERDEMLGANVVAHLGSQAAPPPNPGYNPFYGSGNPWDFGGDFRPPTMDDVREAAERIRREQERTRQAAGNPFYSSAAEEIRREAERRRRATSNPFLGDDAARRWVEEERARARAKEQERARQQYAPPPSSRSSSPMAAEYAALFLVVGAPVELVRAAHRALALLYHPDRGPGNENKLVAVNVARDKILKNLGEDKIQ